MGPGRGYPDACETDEAGLGCELWTCVTLGRAVRRKANLVAAEALGGLIPTKG